MSSVKLWLLSVLVLGAAHGQQMHFVPMAPGAVPTLAKWTVANSGANFLITNPDATTSTVAKAAALTQSVTVFALPANSIVLACYIKTSTAFAGTTTLTGTLGITGTLTACISTPYDLNAAVSNTNNAAVSLAVPVISVAGTNLILALTGTVSNLSSISAGSVTVEILWATLL
jgi:hypothetical protein